MLSSVNSVIHSSYCRRPRQTGIRFSNGRSTDAIIATRRLAAGKSATQQVGKLAPFIFLWRRAIFVRHSTPRPPPPAGQKFDARHLLRFLSQPEGRQNEKVLWAMVEFGYRGFAGHGLSGFASERQHSGQIALEQFRRS